MHVAFIIDFIGVMKMSEEFEIMRVEDFVYRIEDEKTGIEVLDCFRKRNALNLKGLGKVLGVSESSASRIVANLQHLNLRNYIKALRYFGYTLYAKPIEFNPDTGEPEDYNEDDYNELDRINFEIETNLGKYKESNKSV